MPKRSDISSVLIIGAGSIVIGQAAEFATSQLANGCVPVQRFVESIK
jgi:hypothetical protein